MDTNFINELYNEEIESKQKFENSILRESLSNKLMILFNQKKKEREKKFL